MKKSVWEVALLFTISNITFLLNAQEEINFADLLLDENALRGSRWLGDYKGKITVEHSVDIVDISRVNVEAMSLRIEYFLRQRWVATNLTFPPGLFLEDDTRKTLIVAPAKVLNYVWSPDSYLPNARETKISSFSAQQTIATIRKNRTITFSARLYTVLACSFNFVWYPLDRQNCDLIVESYEWPSDKVLYTWDEYTPVTTSQIKLHQYSLQPLKTDIGVSHRFGMGESFAFVKIRFTFERNIAHHFIQIFIPTILILILSWFSFWLDLDIISGRIGLLITCMLTIVTMHTGLRGDLPPVNYIKMIDIWMVSCMTFIFAALCQCFIVISIKRDETAKKKKEEDRLAKRCNNSSGITDEKFGDGIHKNAWDLPANDTQNDGILARLTTGELSAAYWRRKRVIRYSTWETIDKACRWAFPLSFVIFIAIYWPILIMGSDTQES